MKPFVLFSSLPFNVLFFLIVVACALALICIAIYIAIACYVLQELLELEIEETSNSDESKVENGLQREKMKEIVAEGFQCFTGDETTNQPDSEDSKAQWKFEETSTDSETFWEIKGQAVSGDLPVYSERHSKEELDKVVKQKGKTLMEEEPYAAAIDEYYLPYTCSKCFDWITFCNHRIFLQCCGHCKVIFYCSKACQKADWEDHKAECEYFRSCDRFLIPSTEVRLVARILRKSESQPEWKAFNGRTYYSLMDHYDEHRIDQKYMARMKEEFSEFQKLIGPDAPAFDTFFQARCKVDINAFGIRIYSPKQEVRGISLYVGCRPDAFVVFDGSKLLLRTTDTSLLYSDKVTINYRPTAFLNRDERRETLLKDYFFYCLCVDCVDKDVREKEESGRPRCCLNGWFSFNKPRCSICFIPIYKEHWDAFEANESLKTFLKSDKCVSRFDDTDMYDSCHSRSEGTLMSMITDFQTYQKLLSDDNVYLRKLAKMIYNHSIRITRCHYSEVKIKYGQVYYSMMSKQPYTFEFLHFIYDWGNNLRRAEMLLPLEAVEKAIDMGEVLCGENHYLTQFLKQQMPQLLELYTA